jgi:hypothetical protein
MVHVHVSAFQPFESRRGVDTVLALRFRYDPDLIAVLKDALQEARRRGYGNNLGGWLAEHHCWFVERHVWPVVADRLREFGCTFAVRDGEKSRQTGTASEGERHEHKSNNSAPAEWRTIYRQWFAGLARDYHPDRTLDDGKAMAVINDAAERLRKLVETT